jgi:hypothetical protein
MSSGVGGEEGALERIFFAALANSSFFEALSVEAAFNASTCEAPLSLVAEAVLLALVAAEALPMLNLPSVNWIDSMCPRKLLDGSI